MLSITAEIIHGEITKRNYSSMTIDQIYDCLHEVDGRIVIKDNDTVFFDNESPLIELYWHLIKWYNKYKADKTTDFSYNTVEHCEAILHFDYCDAGTWQIDSVFKQCDSPLTVSSMEFNEVIGRFVSELDNLFYDPTVPITPKKRKSYFFSRFLAYTADWIIISLICLGIFYIALVVFRPDQLNFRMPLAFLGIAAFFILPLLKDMVFKDGSIGKKLFCLKIVDENTWRKPDTMQRVVRNVPFHLAGFNIFFFSIYQKIHRRSFHKHRCSQKRKDSCSYESYL